MDQATRDPQYHPVSVPDQLVYNFDIYRDPRLGLNIQQSYADALRDAPDIFWTEANGGHWIAKSHDAVSAIVGDPEHFSVREMNIPRVANPPFFIPLSLDPPENLPYRRAMAPMFGPVAIKALEPRIREWAVRIVDAVADAGRCDFQADVAKLFPVSVFMELMGMDHSRLAEFRHLAESFFDVQNNEAELGRLGSEIQTMLRALIDEKRGSPDDRLLSHFITVDIGGRVMSDDEILAMTFVLFLGGMDTVTNLTGFAYQQLAQMPELQAKLASDPGAIPAFTDEAIRLHGVINTLRLVVKERTISGVTFRPGEMVMAALSTASRDPARYDAPDAMNLERGRTAHLTFSSGPHLCVGHVLARAEIRILTEEWLRRVPAFRLSETSRRHFRAGTVMALENLPIEWDIAR